MSSVIREGIAAAVILAGIGIVAAAESSAGNSAAQQHPSPTTGSASNAMNSVSGSDKLKLTTSQERVVYLSVTQRRTKPSAPEGFTAAVGAVVPASIKLRAMPRTAVKQVPELGAYDYAILPDQILIVDPVAKTVVDVIN
jgi:hypothetical protein